MILLAAVALAQPRVAASGPLRPGVAADLLVASTEGGGGVRGEPTLDLEGATVRAWTELRPGVWRATLVPQPDADRVRISAGGAVTEWPVAPPPPSGLEAPEVVDALVGPEPVRFRVGAAGGVSPSDLQVVTSEGAAIGLHAVDGQVEVELRPDDLPYPRWLVVGVRDLRAEERPAWIRVRLRARPRLPLQAEPGSRLTLAVGGRSYGPFTADETGAIEARVDQLPGELVASAVLVDDLGNETRTDLPLVASTDPVLVAARSGDLLPGRAPPVVHLLGLSPSGGRSPAPPSCGAAFGDLPVIPEGEGEWLVPLPALDPPRDLRVSCALGPARVSPKVSVAAEVPSALSLRVWPQELRADLSEAEIRVTLEDWRGERLPVEGVEVSADAGAVEVDEQGGIVLSGTYDGAAAVPLGQDTLRARYRSPPGSGPPAEVRFGWSEIPLRGPFQVHVRTLDASRRPVAAPAEVEIGGLTSAVTTGSDGWTSVLGEAAGDGEPILVVARIGGREHPWWLVPGEAAGPGPGSSDLSSAAEVTLRPGRASGLDLQVQPPILRAGPGAVAFVTVRLEDGAGQPITDEVPALTASIGSLGPPVPQSDGSFVAEYAPPVVDDTSQVEISATTSTIRSSTRLQVEPRVVRLSLGPWLGAMTNFGPRVRPVVGVDLDVRTRTRLAGEALMVRFGVASSAFSHEADLGFGEPMQLRSTVVPVSLAVLLRGDRGAWSAWGGVGGALAAHRLQASFEGQRLAEGTAALFGPELHGAVARRALAGELALSLRGTWLPASNEEIGYVGNLGGVASSLGYRLAW